MEILIVLMLGAFVCGMMADALIIHLIDRFCKKPRVRL